MSQLPSPEKYIRTKARTLPLEACLINSDWEEHGLAVVAVLRRHPKGTITAGIFMVDIFCLGVKDCFYLFSEPREVIEENLSLIPVGNFYEEEYEKVHNIIFNAIDFAASFNVSPHKDFQLAKYILEPEDSIEFMETPVGGKNGQPVFVTTRDYPQNSMVIAKLKKHFGEGGFSMLFNDPVWEEDDDSWDDEEDYLDEDDFLVEGEEDDEAENGDEIFSPEYNELIKRVFAEHFEYAPSFHQEADELSGIILSGNIIPGARSGNIIPQDIRELFHQIESMRDNYWQDLDFENAYAALDKMINTYPQTEDLYLLYLDICDYDLMEKEEERVCKELLKRFPESVRARIAAGKYFLGEMLLDEFEALWKQPFSFRSAIEEFNELYREDIIKMAQLFIDHYYESDIEKSEIIFEALKKTNLFEESLRELELDIILAKEDYLVERGIEIIPDDEVMS